MKTDQVRQFVLRYLEATNCQIIEKAPNKVTVKLSPEADRDLTNRSYYWGFVDRTGAEPETMTFTFLFEKEEAPEPKPTAASDSILGRYLGVAPAATGYGGRIIPDDVRFGSRRLQQIFNVAKLKGRCTHLYEELGQTGLVAGSSGYSSWLCVNYKAEFVCDLKRDEVCSLGISLSTGEIVEDFYSKLSGKKLTPKLPAHTHIRETISLQRALQELEQYVLKKIKAYDHAWADEAHLRLEDELSRITTYYEEAIAAAEDGVKPQVEEQYESRKAEIEWQYRPRISVSVINCGIFHLTNDSFHKL